MPHQAEGAIGHRRQTVFDEGLETLLDHDLRQHAVPGLFEAEDQLLADRLRLQEGGLPEALLDAIAVDQDDTRHTHGRHGLEHPTQHFGAWQGQYQGQWQLGWWWLVEDDAQFRFVGVQAQHLGRTHQAADPPDAHAVTDFAAVDFLHVRQPAITQDHPVGRNEIGLFKEQQVHAWVAGGWSL
ncbi:hypothetical protein D3C78_1178840 [compost metagenome]